MFVNALLKQKYLHFRKIGLLGKQRSEVLFKALVNIMSSILSSACTNRYRGAFCDFGLVYLNEPFKRLILSRFYDPNFVIFLIYH